MRNQRPWIAVIFSVGFFVLPFAVSAAGLVPCGTSADPNGATGCQACNLVELFNGIINFLLGLSIPIAMVLLAYAGILYFTSAARPANIEKAKRIFYTAFFGFLIALGSFLIVDTILHIILDESFWKDWHTIQCNSGNRPMHENLSTLLGQITGHVTPAPTPPTRDIPPQTGSSNAGTGAGGFAGAGRGAGYCVTPGLHYDPVQDACVDAGGVVTFEESPQYAPAVIGFYCPSDPVTGDQLYYSGGDCIDAQNYPHYDVSPQYNSPSSIPSYPTTKGSLTAVQSQLCAISGGSGLDCALALAVMDIETTACTRDLVGKTGDYGCMQVTCDAGRAFAPFPNDRFTRSSSCDVINQAMLNDTQLNMQTGVNELLACQASPLTTPKLNGKLPNETLTNVQLIGACYNGGMGSKGGVQPSVSCPGLRTFQCTTVPNNFQVTRDYVKSIQADYQQYKSIGL